MCARAPEASPGVARSRGFQRPPLRSGRGIRERPQMSRRPSAHAKDRCDEHCSPVCEPALWVESALHDRGMGGQTVQVPWEVLHVARSGQRFVVSLLQPLTPQASPPEDKSPSASTARAFPSEHAQAALLLAVRGVRDPGSGQRAGCQDQCEELQRHHDPRPSSTAEVDTRFAHRSHLLESPKPVIPQFTPL